ncbi:MAG: 4Fe-4S dicluster domain-containing protein [Lentisphaerae bacterium]|nr:4Fe-4S dicluster domain-containing protein [Lentisphaerota bacterium]
MIAKSGEPSSAPVGAVLVLGGGVAGIQAALDLAEAGQKVYLLESRASIGGTMASLDKTFPTNDCAMCILSPKLVQAGRHLNIELITYADLEKVEGEAGRFRVRIKRKPRYVDPAKCTGCGDCATVDVPDPAELVEHRGELWIRRLDIDEVKCTQCGDCVRACRKENPEAPAMGSVHHRQSEEAQPGRRTAGADLRDLRNMDGAGRLAYWRRHMSRCIKCYGCRDVCPVFVESECRMEEWARPGRLPPDAPLYHLARAYYIAARCTHCGYCEDVCPGDLPLRTLVDLVRHADPGDLFEFVPGLPAAAGRRMRRAFPLPKKAEGTA